MPMNPLTTFAGTMDRVNRQVLGLLGVDFSPRIVLIFTSRPGQKTRLDVACEGRGADGRPPHRNIQVDAKTGERRYWASAQPGGIEPPGCHFSLPVGADETNADNFRCLDDDWRQCAPQRVEIELRNGERIIELRCKQ